jgi:subtilisin family serine protease
MNLFKKKKIILFIVSIVIFSSVSCKYSGENSVSHEDETEMLHKYSMGNSQMQEGDYFVPGRVIVQFKPEKITSDEINEKNISPIIKNFKLKSIERLMPDKIKEKIKARHLKAGKLSESIVHANIEKMSRNTLLVFEDITKEQTKQIINQLKKDERVEYAEPDYILNAVSIIPNDPYFLNQWGLNNGSSDADIDAPEAWDISTGNNSVIVAVIDTGVDYGHWDLDDNCIAGYDYCNNDNDPMDDNSHGTHVAGIIGAKGNNGIGIAGVIWQVKIMPLKFLDGAGSGYTSRAIQCIDYAIAHNADIINASWGDYELNNSLYSAIYAAKNADILFVAAAGNGGIDGVGDNNDSTPFYPASYGHDNIIAVASTYSDDTLSNFSNYGYGSVDIAAPGSHIYSITLGTYAYKNGTSMAAPFVSGAAALLKSECDYCTYSQVKDIIMKSVDKLSSLQGKVVSGGRLNIYKMITAERPCGVCDPRPCVKCSCLPQGHCLQYCD